MHNRLIVRMLIALIIGLGALMFTPSSVDAAPQYPVVYKQYPLVHKQYRMVRKAIHRTHVLIEHANQIVKEGGKDKADLRKAVVDNMAARWCVNHAKPVEAMYLTLKARALARMVIIANKAEIPKGEETDAQWETNMANGADQKAADSAVANADKKVPN